MLLESGLPVFLLMILRLSESCVGVGSKNKTRHRMKNTATPTRPSALYDAMVQKSITKKKREGREREIER